MDRCSGQRADTLMDRWIDENTDIGRVLARVMVTVTFMVVRVLRSQAVC